MLNNSDIAPSASINRWIVSILTFHFELQHVPGKQHGPDGLSRRPPQPGNLLEEEDDPEEFDDWVNNLYGFTHLINPSLPVTWSASFLFTLASQLATLQPSALANSDAPIEYYKVLRSEAAIQADKRLAAAHDWLITFEHPDDTSDHEYALIIRYTSGFFVNDYVLWKRNAQGTHKRVLNQGQQVVAMIAAHNDVGHRGFYPTNMLAAERYWWPFMGRDIAWFICTCHICQTRQTCQVAIPPVVATPAPLFAKMYMDTMHLLLEVRQARSVSVVEEKTKFIPTCWRCDKHAQS